MKMQDSLFKYYENFQDGNSRALTQAQGPSKDVALCDCIGHMPMKSALSMVQVKPDTDLRFLFPNQVCECLKRISDSQIGDIVLEVPLINFLMS